jgi:hypothetical protein
MAIDRESRDHLTALAGALVTWQGVSATVRTAHDGGPICVATNMCAPMISEEITVRGGNFVYSWGDAISSVDDIPTAAVLIIRVIKDQEHVGQSLPEM